MSILIFIVIRWYSEKNKILRILVLLLFIDFYFNNYDVDYFKKGDYYQSLDYSNEIYNSGNYTSICIRSEGKGEVYTFLYYKISPYEFQKSNKYIYDCKDYDSNLIYVTKDISSFSDDNLNIKKFGEYYVVYGNEKE